MTENFNKNQETGTGDSVLKDVAQFLWDLVKILVIAMVIILPFRWYVAEPFVVSGSSMVPNYHNHDYLIIDRLSYLRSLPKRGDVVVLKFPKDTSQFFIKRIIGLPGETVTIKQGFVEIINPEHSEGFRLTEPYLPNQQETFGQGGSVHLAVDQYFVLGDNRTASSDSRVWGILPRDLIVGKVWARVFPFSGASFFHTPNYN